MTTSLTYTVTVLLDVNETQDVDDRAESRSYLVADRESGQAVIIDSVIENVERDVKIVKELGLTLLFAVETHVHADHITGASLLKDRTGAQIVYGGGAAGAVTGADLFLPDGHQLRFGHSALNALATPGHTDGCTSYVLPGAVFTGDTLFIRGNGRTDLQGGVFRHALRIGPSQALRTPGRHGCLSRPRLSGQGLLDHRRRKAVQRTAQPLDRQRQLHRLDEQAQAAQACQSRYRRPGQFARRPYGVMKTSCISHAIRTCRFQDTQTARSFQRDLDGLQDRPPSDEQRNTPPEERATVS